MCCFCVLFMYVLKYIRGLEVPVSCRQWAVYLGAEMCL